MISSRSMLKHTRTIILIFTVELDLIWRIPTILNLPLHNNGNEGFLRSIRQPNSFASLSILKGNNLFGTKSSLCLPRQRNAFHQAYELCHLFDSIGCAEKGPFPLNINQMHYQFAVCGCIVEWRE